MHLSIRVSTADPRTPDELTLTTQCMSVFVVPGAAGVALPVPQWEPTTDEDARLARARAGDHPAARDDIVPIAASLTLEP